MCTLALPFPHVFSNLLIKKNKTQCSIYSILNQIKLLIGEEIFILEIGLRGATILLKKSDYSKADQTWIICVNFFEKTFDISATNIDDEICMVDENENVVIYFKNDLICMLNNFFRRQFNDM